MAKEFREVMWSEGMFLLPHHFQFTGRNLDTKLRSATEHLSPCNWGFKHLEIDAASIKNYQFTVRNCQVVLEDGAQLSMPGNMDLDSRSFKEGVAGTAEYLDVFIGIPGWRPDTPNTLMEASEEEMTTRRFRADETEIVDENLGENPRAIQIKRFKGRLFWGTEDMTGYEKIQVARIKMSPSGETVMLDPEFMPPVVDIRAWPPLLAVCEDINNGLAMANAALVRDFSDRELSELLGVPRGLEAVIKMLATNGHVAGLGQLCRTPNLHPYLIYLELLKLAATLELFKSKRAAPSFPDYRHDKLGNCFLAIKDIIDGLLDRIGTSTFFQKTFQFRNERLEIDLQQEWLSGNRLFYIGISGEESVSRLDRNVGRLKLCSPKDIETVTHKRLQGVGLRRLRRVPATLPERPGTFYFQIDMEGTFWRNIVEDRVIAVSGNRDMNYKFNLFVV